MSRSCRQLLVLASATCIALSSTAIAQPRLVLQITVDQLRGDLPTRYYNRLGEGGFRYLWDEVIDRRLWVYD